MDGGPLSARDVLLELARRQGNLDALIPKHDAAARRVSLLDPKHQHQYALYTDPAAKLACDSGGRSGKTTGSIRWLMEGALEAPRSMNPFIGLTREEGKLLAWDEIKAVNDAFALGFTFNEQSLIARAQNGAKVWVTGADQERHIRKMRGHKYRRVVFEECGAQGSHLKELVEEVVEPRTADLRGQMCMLGTPNRARAGYFFDAIHGVNGAKGWKHHHWTLFENPYMPHARQWVRENLFDKEKGRGWTEDHPTYQREYLGLWVRDDSAAVYDFVPARNTFSVLPEVDRWRAVLGIDTGWKDATAFFVWGWHPSQRGLYELYSFKRPKLGITPIMKLVAKLHETFGLRAAVIDPAGVGTFLVDELNERWAKQLRGLKIELAEKSAKHDHIQLFNDDMRTERIKVRAGSPICEEWALLQWDETGEDEDERFENHLADAALYGWRRAQHFRHKPKPEGPPQGSAEWERQLQREAARALEKRHKKNNRTLDNDPLSPNYRR